MHTDDVPPVVVTTWSSRSPSNVVADADRVSTAEVARLRDGRFRERRAGVLQARRRETTFDPTRALTSVDLPALGRRPGWRSRPEPAFDHRSLATS
jgi:hypothetical protein